MTLCACSCTNVNCNSLFEARATTEFSDVVRTNTSEDLCNTTFVLHVLKSVLEVQRWAAYYFSRIKGRWDNEVHQHQEAQLSSSRPDNTKKGRDIHHQWICEDTMTLIWQQVNIIFNQMGTQCDQFYWRTTKATWFCIKGEMTMLRANYWNGYHQCNSLYCFLLYNDNDGAVMYKCKLIINCSN